jgi:cytochrome P450
MAKLGSESIGAGRLENVTIRTIGGMLDIALADASTQIDRTKAVMANSVSAAKSTGWADDNFCQTIKNLDAIRQAFDTLIDGAKKVAEDAKNMEVRKSEMDGVAFGGPGAD